MTGSMRALIGIALCGWLALVAGPLAHAQEPCRVIMPEQRQIQIRDPARLARPRMPAAPTPPTVTTPNPPDECPVWNLSLDEAIRIALDNSDVIRVLGGSSGRTIYDPAVTNTQIDAARGRFDPNLQSDNNFYRHERPGEAFDPTDPSRVIIDGPATNDYTTGTGLTKVSPTGATLGVGVAADPTQYNVPGYPLNPRVPSSVEMSLTQPLLQGGGWAANMAPIQIAQIDTERSFFQMKDAVQEMVRGVIEAYWSLVAARADLWARQQQVNQTEYAVGLADARLTSGLGSRADVAQARSSLADFRAALITAKATVLVREAALRNILGLPPSVPSRIVPVSAPTAERMEVSWPDVLQVASMRRPDLIELKLILEADQQRQIVRRNEALPRVDAVALYRWNGLYGRTPDRAIESTRAGQFAEWQLGVTFSVPLGQRTSRARLREEELLIRRDWANLNQGMHEASHLLAQNYRNLSEYYDLYRAYQDSRTASAQNLDVQWAVYSSGLNVAGEPALYLNVLQAINAWGNAVSAEARSLTAYNTELANLERQTGIILEAHGIRFVQERFAAIGPMGRLFADRCYPRDVRPGPNAPRYPVSDEPAENAFDLKNPVAGRQRHVTPSPKVDPLPPVDTPPTRDDVQPSPTSGPTSAPSEIRVLRPEEIAPPTPLPPVKPSRMSPFAPRK